VRRFSAPGKLLLAGEYAVLHAGRSCLVAAVERRLRVDATPAAEWSVTHGDATWRPGDDATASLAFCVAAVQRAQALGAAPRALVTHDDLCVDGLKLGLGSSAAATVATLAAACDGLGLSREQLWREADALHRAVQGGRGSGADVTASSWGGIVRYRRDPHAAAPVPVHPDVRIVAVWTGASVKTSPRLATFEAWCRAHPDAAQRFGEASEGAVEALSLALATGDGAGLRDAVRAAREVLRGLERKSGLLLETPALARAAEVAERFGAAAKLSGAGGGDCAVALVVGDAAAAGLVRVMVDAGLAAFVLPAAKEGLHVEEA
jgi:phosphomevalonate kinase